MVKPEWGAKHGCPKCGTRFYDLGKGDPVTCVECGYAWHPEPVADSDLADEDLEGVDDDQDSPDNDVDLGGDDDLGVAGHEDEEEH
jgi:hypothetical protein